jgi:FkbM family methyltransferase
MTTPRAGEESPWRERARVRMARVTLRHWPFRRGHGVLLRLFRPILPRAPFVMELEPGIAVAADLEDYVVLHYFVYGFRRDPAFRLVRDLVRPGDTVIDVGANAGLWIMGIARRAGATAVVHAFEPVPGNFERLTVNVERNNLTWVHCHRLALSDVAGRAQFQMPPSGNTGAGSLGTREAAGSFDVQVSTLDGFCQENALARVHLLKVDVEGAELRVFKGAAGLLGSKQPPFITFEVGESLAAAFGTSAAVVKAFLGQFGYAIYRHRGNFLETVPADERHPMSEDLFAVHPTHFGAYAALRRLVR